MRIRTPNPTDPFRTLEAALIRRRLQSVETILRVELLALVVLSTGFVFWQTRVPLDGLVHRDGPHMYLVVIGAAAAFLGVLGAALAGTRHAAQLRQGPEGPPWLALPIDMPRLERHLAWNARGRAFPLLVPATGLLAAGVGLVPWWWLPLLALAMAGVLDLTVRAGCWIATRLAARSAIRPPGAHPVLVLLSSRVPRREKPAHLATRWVQWPPWRVLLAKDLSLTWRVPAARRLAMTVVVVTALSAAAWLLPVDVPLARVAAFALALLAAATLAEWLILLAGSDPSAVIRTLPIGLREIWGMRAAWSLAGALVLVVAHAAMAPELSPVAIRLFLTWTGAAALGIGLLGANYGITLFPRTDLARRMLALSLGMAMAGSLMIPLLGWVLLLAAIIHSARRLPRWWRSEPA